MLSDDIEIVCFIPKRPAFIWTRMSVNLTLKLKMIVKTKRKKNQQHCGWLSQNIS